MSFNISYIPIALVVSIIKYSLSEFIGSHWSM